MKRRVSIVAMVVLAAGGFLVVGDGAEPARAEGATSGWTWYTYWYQYPEVKTGKGAGHAATPWFGFDLEFSTLRTTWVSGTEEGSRQSSGFGLVGLKVLEPMDGIQYSWSADVMLADLVLKAKVELEDRGLVCGRAEGYAGIDLVGDLKLSCSRAVAAKDFRGGQWAISFPPAYLPPDGPKILYRRAEHAARLEGRGQNAGSGTHVQVLGRTRVGGSSLAYCQAGVDRRSARCESRLLGSATITLKGFTAIPTDPNKPPVPVISADLQVDNNRVTVTAELAGTDYSPGPAADPTGLPPLPPPPPGREEDDFTLEDW
jgi:hypothetical protein